jgi:hypothetical protein
VTSVVETDDDLTTAVERLRQKHDGDKIAVELELERLCKQEFKRLWPEKHFWEGGHSCRSETEDGLLQRFRNLPDDLKTAVLAEADSRIGEPWKWACALIDNAKSVYIYHPAVVLRMALDHPLFRHIPLECAAAMFKCTPDSWHSKHMFEPFDRVALNLAERFGVGCSECDRITCIDMDRSHPLGHVNAEGFRKSLPSDPHVWSCGMCPSCWGRTAPARRKAAAQAEIAERARARAIEHARQIVRRRPKRQQVAAPPRPRRQYSKKVMIWKAAYDALRELGVPMPKAEK